jgi:RsiW-degrading membrane proteinase PrsW (M82 family)
MDHISITTIIFAILGGALPTLGWLYFWLREDKIRPEPKFLIFLTFIAGGIAVLISLYLEKLIVRVDVREMFFFRNFSHLWGWFTNIAIQYDLSFKRLLMVSFFAPIIEETVKFFSAYFLALKNKNNDEPLDPIIYMITVALGFAAIENTLFLIGPIDNNQVIYSIMTGNIRFIGATLLHTVSSATLGMFMGFKFFNFRWSRRIWTIIGLILAVLLHSLFNFFIIINQNESTIAVIESIWVAVIIVLLLFERIKKIKINKI